MKTSHAALLLLAGSAPLAGCASASRAYQSASERAISEPGHREGIRFDDASVEEQFARSAQIPIPMKLALVGVERNPYGVFSDVDTAAFEKSLAAEPLLVRDVVPLFELLVAQQSRTFDVDLLRRAAARAHADVLLVYEQKVDVHEGPNLLAILNLTIVGNFIFPGLSYDLTLETRAAVVDVRSGVVYTAVSDVRGGHGTAPYASAGDHARATKARLRQEAFTALQAALKDKLARYAAHGLAPAPALESSLRYETDGRR